MINFRDAEEKFGKLKDKKYIVVMDLELTCWEGQQWSEKQEIIEIGGVVCDAENLGLIHTFSTCVKPIYYPELSEYCMELTGISQDEINQSKNLNVELSVLFDKGLLPDPKEFVWATWGRDPVFLQAEIEKKTYKKKRMIEFDPRYINVKAHDNKRRGLKKALRAYGIKQTEPAHRALSDAISTYDLLVKMDLDVEDVHVSNTRTYRKMITSEQEQMADKFSKRNNFELDKSKKLLKYLDYNYQKAQKVLTLIQK